MTLTVYSQPNCVFCDRAKALIESKGLFYISVDITKDDEARSFLIEQGLRSVPQIYNDSKLIEGGYTGLLAQPDSFWEKL